ncbi:MAG TPA: hypothetical protein VFB35_08320 [Gaiellaceae bacterium]|nr:hypothetical protein [Gaiellaceae bacterium]
MRPSPGTSAAREYAGTMAGFWSGLSATLRALETLAADRRRLDERVGDQLRGLQYRLHWSSELLAGVDPPAGAREAHEELASALVDARDATGEIADALEDGRAGEAAVLEWRGALFRVRLARMRLVPRPPVRREPPAESFPVLAALATALTVAGVGAFAAGAVLVLWPLWAAGLGLVAGGCLVYRP